MNKERRTAVTNENEHVSTAHAAAQLNYKRQSKLNKRKRHRKNMKKKSMRDRQNQLLLSSNKKHSNIITDEYGIKRIQSSRIRDGLAQWKQKAQDNIKLKNNNHNDTNNHGDSIRLSSFKLENTKGAKTKKKHSFGPRNVTLHVE